ncbi:MAG: hypothetical protein P4L84_09975 [Isosphaeraceae bacterium]|nr:hypothetical protein [Isosphaeraceae bacterium]
MHGGGVHDGGWCEGGEQTGDVGHVGVVGQFCPAELHEERLVPPVSHWGSVEFDQPPQSVDELEP